MRRIVPGLLLVAVVGCKTERQAVSAPSATPPAPVVAPQTTPATPTAAPLVWSRTPPMTGTRQLALERSGRLMRITERGAGVTFPIPELSGCVVEVPPPAAEAGEDQKVEWVVLRGEKESASLRFSTRGVLLAVQADCLRVADLAPALLGTPAESTDPVFEAGPREDAIPTASLSYAADGKRGTVSRDGTPVLDIRHFEGTPTFTGLASDLGPRARLVIEHETEWDGGESAAGREHTLVWLLGDAPLLVLENDFRFGADGADHEEDETTVSRRNVLDGGAAVVEGRRERVEHALNVGAGKCPEMEGAISFEHLEESVTWMIEPSDGKPIRVATTSARATQASGCEDAVPKKEFRVGSIIGPRVPRDEVKWDVIVQDAD